MNISNKTQNKKNKEVSEIYKIFKKIYLAAPPVLKDLSDSSVDIDYMESILNKIDFKTINTKFKNGEYYSITDAIKDIRAVFINCYSFYGARSDLTKKSLKLEAILEEKISCLEENFRLLADVNLTFNLLNMDRKPSSKLRYPKDCYDSILLRNVAHCRPQRLKEYHRILSTKLTTNEDNAHILEKILIWEHEVYFNDIFHQYISSMCELPEIGHFVAIIFKKLDFEIINQGEIERMFLLPKESTTMSKIMTTLLKPVKKSKFIGQVMPYKVWSEQLSNNISEWCKVYHAKNKNKVHAMNLLGINPDFWAIVNEKNPLIEKDFCELSYFMKVWLVKGLCDYVTIKFKTINDIVTNSKEKQCTIWKNDLETEEYFFFNTMPDLRIYYYNIPYEEPSLEFLESVKLDKKKVEDNVFAKKKEKHFKLIANSVEGLRSYVDELDVEGSLIPENLINALEELIVKLEPEEYNFIKLNNDSKIKMFKDWTLYSDKIANDMDNKSLGTKKDRKSSLVQNKEIIIGKRCRKSIVKQDFKTNKYFESDEYDSENEMSIADYTDSEDEWGTINLSKNKVKPKLKPPSKIEELEKQLTAEKKIPNHDIKKTVKVKHVKNTNILVDGHIKTPICSTNKVNSSLLEEKDTKLIATAENKEICLKNRKTKLVVHQDFEEKMLYETDDFVSVNDMAMTGSTHFKAEWGTVNQPKFNGEQSSEFVKQGKRLMTEKKMPNHNTKKKMINNNMNNNFDTYKNDKSICLVKIENSENEVKSSYKTNNLVNGNDKILMNSKNINSFNSDTDIVLIDSDEEENENPPNNLKKIEVIVIDDEDMQNDWETVNDHPEITTNNCTEDNKKKINAILIEDKEIDQILISDDEDDVQFVSSFQTANNSPFKINEIYSLNKNFKSSYKSVPSYRQTTPSKRQATSPITPTLFRQNISATPRLSHNISTTQRLPQNISATPRLSQNISATPRLSQNISATPRRSQNISATPRLSHNISTTQRLSQNISATPRRSQNISATPIRSQNISITPILSKNVSATPIRSQNISITPILSKNVSATPRHSQNISVLPRLSQNVSVTPILSKNISLMSRLSKNISIIPANIHIPKDIEITTVKSPQPIINSYFNSTKRRSTIMPNSRIQNDASTVNVKCEVYSKTDLNGEVKFYIRLPNGKEHPGPNELINQYLKQHNNQLPDYWLIPLSVEVAKKYGL